MSDERDPDFSLREMAQHRGFKLLKSRRRKPGAGDFGRFGLSDAAGKPVMGVGPGGLTALPDEIEAFLRAGALDSWKASAKAAPDAPRSPKAVRDHDDTEKEGLNRRSGAHAERSEDRPARRIWNTKQPDLPRSPRPTKARLEKHARGGAQKGSAQSRGSELAPPTALTIRKPRKEDVAAIAALLGELPGVDRTAQDVSEGMATARKAGGGVLLADQNGTIGCIAWVLLPTIHRGTIGRITALVVTSKKRRKGIGRKLVDGALEALAHAGCDEVEAMSDIDLRNAHGFFRSLDFVQASYRFTRSPRPKGT
ncbi:GNAT family N-acetyltransferase [Novosphingobium kaempferiae]|uniref:GNAT family N-acetyltransferase n=1 Tax=Novosphingobium kaempferiae TaxID=2896849 RepID=UPI001E398BE5|nr:GNAT family N-acetyltransferase [Novosphingobium kaempferiae]